MNPWVVLPSLAALSILYVLFPIGLDAFSIYRHRKQVPCPATGKHAHVQVDARRAAFSATIGRPSLRVTSCSLWPERQGCGQNCLSLPYREMRDLPGRDAV